MALLNKMACFLEARKQPVFQRCSQLYFEPKILGVRSKLSLQWALKVTHFTFLKPGATPF